LHAADADAAWTEGLIRRLEGGAYTFAGEGEPFSGMHVVLAEGERNPYATGERHPGDER
ncbi:PadR family transcriptional regulator, partial [Streptomyces sp. TRM76130]|nr:PadR family transcriptional regulator [Streptomyces sp. TRM76130]